jgi:hypothetical protein
MMSDDDDDDDDDANDRHHDYKDDMTFSNSLIIHEDKTKKITSLRFS